MIWPPERFYWSVIDVPGWKKTGQVPAALLYELQHDLPIAAEELHAVCTPLTDGRMLVCAAERGQLSQLDAATLTLAPGELPAFLQHEGDNDRNVPNDLALAEAARNGRMTAMHLASELPDPTLLNLLVGEFEAAPIRRARRRRHGLRLIATMLCVILAWSGLERRANLLTRQAAISNGSVDADHGDARVLNPDELAQQLAFLSQLRIAVGKVPAVRDSATTLAALLRSWPASTEAVPQSVSITPSTMTVSLATPSEPSEFLRSFQPPGGWRLEEPRVSAGPVSSRIMLEMHALASNRGAP